jgi:hypothetical protein
MTVLDNVLLGVGDHPGERLLSLARHPIAWGAPERRNRDRAYDALDGGARETACL